MWFRLKEESSWSRLRASVKLFFITNPLLGHSSQSRDYLLGFSIHLPSFQALIASKIWSSATTSVSTSTSRVLSYDFSFSLTGEICSSKSSVSCLGILTFGDTGLLLNLGSSWAASLWGLGDWIDFSYLKLCLLTAREASYTLSHDTENGLVFLNRGVKGVFLLTELDSFLVLDFCRSFYLGFTGECLDRVESLVAEKVVFLRELITVLLVA